MRATVPEVTCSGECQSSHPYQPCTRWALMLLMKRFICCARCWSLIRWAWNWFTLLTRQMVTINFISFQDKRISVIDALAHPYLDEGRLRYHSCMCKCCYTTSGGMRQYTADFEPAATQPFDDLWERKLTSVQQVKGELVVTQSTEFINS